MLRAILALRAAITGLTQTRHFDAVPGVQPMVRATAREPRPDTAKSTIRAPSRIRASLLREPASVSTSSILPLFHLRRSSHHLVNLMSMNPT
jgi:hypothetical protein